MDITFMIRGQTIRMSAPQRIVADTVNFLRAKFLFSDGWKEGIFEYPSTYLPMGYVAYFKCGDESYSAVLSQDHTIEGLNLGAGIWTMHVVGQIVRETTVEVRITTEPIQFEVFSAGEEAGEGFPTIEASYSEQILQKAENAQGAAEAAQERADAAYEKAEEALEELESGGGGGVAFTEGVGIKLSEDNVLSVDSAKDFNGDNTRPAEAAFMQTIVGNIEVLLSTI